MTSNDENIYVSEEDNIAKFEPLKATVSIHDDTISRESVLFNDSILIRSGFESGDLVEINQMLETIEARDFGSKATTNDQHAAESSTYSYSWKASPTYLCLIRTTTPDQATKLHDFEISINKQVAATFNFTSRSLVSVKRAKKQEWIASHVEVSFRDAYLSRSDMWRLTSQELVGKTVHIGQKISFFGSLRATIKKIHVSGRHSQLAYFDTSTVPVFRSEAARYVIFIQMSYEMWDFDSEGSGEILFNRVVNGFLPELFKKWSEMEVRHLVSIVMFGRLEYRRADVTMEASAFLSSPSPAFSESRSDSHQDFYRVVVTDMASAQWTTILEVLKKDFRVFLRDVSLFKDAYTSVNSDPREEGRDYPTRITGRLSGASKGNILEAINLAASQFSNDYIDRDLIRTGISTVIVTAGSGVFTVDKDLLKLTSETLTNNGIGIDIVCLSKMPLHSVPLFRYRLPHSGSHDNIHEMQASPSSSSLNTNPHPSLPDLSHSPAFSATKSSFNYFSRFPSAFPARVPQIFGYGIPQWIDLSYWSSDMGYSKPKRRSRQTTSKGEKSKSNKLFVPRVRMYELQMMGLMEMGMAEIVVPYLNEKSIGKNASLRRWTSQRARSQYGRSLSQSPELKRKSPYAMSRQHDKSEIWRNQHDCSKSFTDFMDEYDDSAFTCDIPRPKARRSSKHRAMDEDIQTSPAIDVPRAKASLLTLQQPHASLKSSGDVDSRSDTESIISNASKTMRPRAPRNISYTFRGLAPLKASAVTPELHVVNIDAHKNLNAVGSSDDCVMDNLASNTTDSLQFYDQAKREYGSVLRAGNKWQKEEGSKPIKIRPAASTITTGKLLKDQLWQQRRHQHEQQKDHGNEIDINLSDSDSKVTDASGSLDSLPNSIPDSTIPFVRNVNASNPLKRKSHSGTFGRWQHLYPRKPKAATVKWKSLCTPASVPLTTEDFPSKAELESNYDALCHVVRTTKRDESQESLQNETHALFLEMISLRVAHGYQFVIGSAPSATFEEEVLDYYAMFDRDVHKKARHVVVLTMGNTIQKLELHSSLSVRVTKYLQKQSDSDKSSYSTFVYNPWVRTILANDYFPRPLVLKGFTEQYSWDIADNHLAGDMNESGELVEKLRYWRARFVLIPVEPPASTWKMNQPDENEEEIHILGIRALTQSWQKNRHTTRQERSVMENRTGPIKHQDINPLEVKMETLNPSELVAIELDRLAQIEEGSETESTQLLPEPQKFDKETSMLQKLALAMQGEKGIEIENRRWHLRLYYNCFRGEEFTNWLMHNVKNMNTREDAVEFGNQLMKEKLFEHVNGRHRFKDGHYFYSIKQEYRVMRPDLQKSWFPSSRQSNKSIPPTPASEQPPKELSPMTVRTRSGSNLAHQLHPTPSSESKALGEKKRKSVSLSRMIRVDVSTKKKSLLPRPEVVNVHYDRFHNPENCYHLELNWLNTTCKLVDDAIVTWTSTAERYGLKLVEVPIAEACDVPLSEPFRNPYRIKPALEPPKQKVNNTTFNNFFFSSTSFGPQQPINASYSDKHIYQKAILKRFNFVLDLEAASEFPEGVDIEYGWGMLKYKYTQFVHRSGVVLAQIMEDGDIILLANRLYNSRLANTKEAANRMFDLRREAGPHSHRPAIPPSSAVSMQASGIVGVNLASPSTVFTSSPSLAPLPNLGIVSSPAPRPSSQAPTSFPSGDSSKGVIADSFGPKTTFAATGLWNALVTPEQIKDSLEAFCLDKGRLEQFYKEVVSTPAPMVTGVPGSGSRKATGSSSSSLLRPVREVPGMVSDITAIPAFELPEAVTAMRELRRATVAYENASEMFDKSGKSRHESGNGSTGG